MMVAEALSYDHINDLPMIRQTANDTADTYRKEGYAVGDFSQDALVKAIQKQMRTMRLAIK